MSGDTTIKGKGLEFNRTREEIEAAAAKRGKRAVYPLRDELFIDLDSEAARLAFLENSAFLGRLGITTTHEINASATEGHYHATVWIADPDVCKLTPWQRPALQAALGDDPKRHLISCARALRGELEAASVFFERA